MSISKALSSPQKAFRKLNRIISHTTEDISRLLLKRSSWSSIVNQKEIRIVGLRRTGNHAIAEWIKAQETGRLEHLNNLDVNCNPYRYKYEKIMDFYPEHKNWALKHYQSLARGNFNPLDCLICGYEDHDLANVFDPFFERFHDLYLGKSGKRFDVIVMRDPFNLFASRLKSNMIDIKTSKLDQVELWIQYAKEFLGETHYLKHNKVCVNYNQWVADIEYRRALADKLDIAFTDAGIDRVASLGGGSSFEGQALDGKGSQMSVLDRWKHLADNSDYLKNFQK